MGKIERLKGDWVTDEQAITKMCCKIDELVDAHNAKENEALRKTCEATQDGTLRKELDKMKELHRCPECNLLMGHDDNCPKIAREAKEPDIYTECPECKIRMVAVTKEPEKPFCTYCGFNTDECECKPKAKPSPEKPVESTISVFHKLMPKPSPTSLSLEKTIYDVVGKYYLVQGLRSELAQAIRQFIRGELESLMVCDSSMFKGMIKKSDAIERLCK